MKNDIQFVRIRGRIVPIKRKKKDKLAASPKKGAAKVAAGIASGAGASFFASKDLKKSFKMFRSAAIFQGAASHQTTKIGKNKIIRKAALSKISAMKLRGSSRIKFGIALGLSSALVSSGVSDFFRKDSEKADEISGAVGGIVGGIIVGQSARRFGIRTNSIADLFSKFSSKGERLSRAKIRKVRGTKLIDYKGF